jgi:hypothetical protein
MALSKLVSPALSSCVLKPAAAECHRYDAFFEPSNAMEESLLDLYRNAGDQTHLRPFIGEAFLSPTSEHFRVMVIGINAYVSPEDWDSADPNWFYKWAKNGDDGFYEQAHRDAKALADALCERSEYYGEYKYIAPDSLYVTNTVKEYLPEETGKSSDNVPQSYFEEGAEVWERELDILADQNALPHLVIVFGSQVWPYACDSMRVEEGKIEYQNFSVEEYNHTSGPCLHFANRIEVSLDENTQTILLTRCYHPSAHERKVTPEWLLNQSDFRQLAGIEDTV